MPMLEYNRFYPAPSGERGEHIKIMCDTVDELDDLLAQVDDLFAHRHGTEPAAPQRAPARQKGDAVKCGKCGGDVWDNRQKKAKGEGNFKPTSPDYSCKDKQGCDWRMWLTDSGDEGEWKPPPR